MKYKNTIALDFDGVIHKMKTANYSVAEEIDGPPISGAKKFCKDLLGRGFNVAIFSSRGGSKRGKPAMQSWLEEHGFPSEIRVVERKPWADVYIDDRAYRFEGDFSQAIAYVGTPGETPLAWIDQGSQKKRNKRNSDGKRSSKASSKRKGKRSGIKTNKTIHKASNRNSRGSRK
jgi:hypothetical protein